MSSTLRVAFTIEQCWHRVPGGTAVAALEMARALEQRGDVELRGVAASHRRPAAPAWSPPIPVAHLPLPRVALYESWHRLRRPNVELATGPVDVIHATTMAMPPKSAPLVLTVHDLLFLRQPAHFTRHGMRFFRRGLALALRDADLALCASQATLRHCEEVGFQEERLRLVPMGVSVAPADRADVERVTARYGLTRDYILWVGTVEPRKNLRGLLQAFRMLPHDAELDLALVGPKGWNEDLEALIGDRQQGVKVLGFVPHDDLGPLYAGATVFCFPSLFEGFGLPVLEAMAQGTPVVTSRSTSTEELGEGASVLVDPRDPASIADGIARLLGDEGLALELSDAGRERAARYSWGRTADLVAAAYKEVA